MDNISNLNQLPLCRTCFQEIINTSSVIYLNSPQDETKLTLRRKLTDIIPELNLDLPQNAVICSDCCNTIESFNEFKSKCLEFEMQINKYIQQMQTTSIIDLKEVVRFHKSQYVKPIIKVEQDYEITEAETKEVKLSNNYDAINLNEVEHIKLAVKEEFLDTYNESITENLPDRKNELAVVFPIPAEEKLLKCDYLFNQNSIQNEMESYLQEKPQEKLFKCKICDYYCSRRSVLEQHKRTHAKPLECAVCNFQCNMKRKLRKHMQIHSKEKFKCLHCPYETNQKGHLQTHVKIHSREKLFKCCLCEYECNQKICLQRHMRTHTKEKPFGCSICDYQCTVKHSLTVHMRIHTKEKPYKCSVCEYRCSQKNSLQSHIRIHSKEKPFKCLFCEYSCIQKNNLQRHIQIHTEEKPFKCSVCEYKCNHKTSLQAHMFIHTNLNPFKCSICEFQCNRKSSLQRHLQIHTKQNSN